MDKVLFQKILKALRSSKDGKGNNQTKIYKKEISGLIKLSLSYRHLPNSQCWASDLMISRQRTEVKVQDPPNMENPTEDPFFIKLGHTHTHPPPKVSSSGNKWTRSKPSPPIATWDPQRTTRKLVFLWQKRTRIPKRLWRQASPHT